MRRLTIAFLAVALAACVTAIAKPPTVSLASLGIESFGLFEQRFLLQLRIKNPNDVDIPIEGLSYDLEVGGHPFASGVSSQAVTVPRLGEALLEVPATSDLGAFLKRFGEKPPTGEGLDYRLRGQVHVGGHGAVPFDHRGEVNLPRLPGQPKKAPKAKELPGAV